MPLSLFSVLHCVCPLSAGSMWSVVVQQKGKKRVGYLMGAPTASATAMVSGYTSPDLTSTPTVRPVGLTTIARSTVGHVTRVSGSRAMSSSPTVPAAQTGILG
ncbi:hypothetical protein K501DRAFT_280705 [Backusella circina FSU 941]|nr:hypothetical protein K501DRAFT_280705 [Backusella circina FSU 941]